jgi:hypothetical protein
MASKIPEKDPSVSEVADDGPARETLDQQITRLASEAPPFYRNHNLLILYLLIIPGCLMPAVTLGFDAAIMNGLQAVPAWDACTSSTPPLKGH